MKHVRDHFKSRSANNAGFPSLRLAKKLDPRLDYEDVDTGPTKASHSPFRQFSYSCKREYHVGVKQKIVMRLAEKSVGQYVDDLYSKVCKVAKGKSYYRHYLQEEAQRELGMSQWSRGEIDEDGRLCYYEPRRHYYRPEPSKIPVKTKDPLVVYDLLECEYTPKYCKCKTFSDYWERPEVQFGKSYDELTYWERHKLKKICIHGNEPVRAKRWFVVYSKYVFKRTAGKVYHTREDKHDRLLEPFRQLPDSYTISFEQRKKSCNKKEIARIKKWIT